MKLDVSKLSFSKITELNEKISFDPELFVCHKPLIEVLDCNVKATIQRFEEFIYVDIKLVADVILECSYTLKHFKTTLKGDDELHFSSIKDEEDDDLIVYKGNVIDLDEYAFNLLSALVPLSPKSPGSKSPNNGKGYRIISDKDLEEELFEKGNSQFDALKDLDLD